MLPNFRAWHKAEKKMFLVLAIDFITETVMVRTNADAGLIDREEGMKGQTIFFMHEPMIDFEVMMGTGLTDKYGDEIFEGDFLKDIIVGRPFPITLEHENGIRIMHGGDLLTHGDARHSKIIGNIYANPEHWRTHNDH